MNAAQERKAVRDWIDTQGIDAGSAVDQLPALEIGEAYVWSPQWLKFFGKIKIAQKETYNASATPTFATKTVTPRALAPADLQTLRDSMQETVRQAEARDPVALRRRIAELEKELRTRPVETKVEKVVERVEVPILKEGQVEQLRQIVSSLSETGEKLVSAAQELSAVLGGAMAQPVSSRHAPPVETRPASRPSPPNPTPRATSTPNGSVQLRAGERKMLETLARRYPLKVTRAQLGTLAGFTPSGGTFGAYLGSLKRTGLIEERTGEIQISEEGLAYLGYSVNMPAPQTTEETLEMWRGALRAGERKMLDELVSIYPNPLTREELGERTGFTARGGTFGAYLGTLRRNGLIEIEGQQIRASNTLFLEAA